MLCEIASRGRPGAARDGGATRSATGRAGAFCCLVAVAALASAVGGMAQGTRRIQGRVVDHLGLPLPAVVTVQGLPVTVTAETDDEGRFELRAPLAAGAKVIVRVGRLKPASASCPYSDRLGAAQCGELRIDVGSAIRGTAVSASDGAPVSGARIRVRAMGPGGTGATDDQATVSLATGRFIVPFLADEIYQLSAEASGWGTLEELATPGGPRLRLVFDKEAAISGQAADAKDVPLTSGRVVARRDGTPGVRVSKMDGNGRFRLGGLREGTYSVTLDAPDFVPTTVGAIGVAAGSASDLGVVRLSAGATVRGQVLDEGGASIAGAEVTITSASTERVADRTNAFGEFAMQGVPREPLHLVATHRRFVTTTLDIEAPADDETNVSLVMSGGGLVQGTVRRSSGTPVANASVTISDADAEPSSTAKRVTTGPDGAYRFTGVRPGMIVVSATAGLEGSQDARTVARSVDVVAGSASVVDIVIPNAVVAGRVLRNGVPLTGARVRLGADGGEPMEAAAGLTGVDGGFRIAGARPGRALVELLSAGGRRLRVVPPIVNVLEDGDTYVELDASSNTVRGVVRSADTLSAIAGASLEAWDENGGRSAATTDAEGVFDLDAPSSEQFQVRVYARGFVPVSLALGAESAGTELAELQLRPGTEMRGLVVDGSGRPVSAATVGVAEIGAPWRGTVRETGPDGRFAIDGLAAEPHSLFVQTRLGDSATIESVNPADANGITVTVASAVSVRCLAVTSEGQPVAGSAVRIVAVNGVPITGSQFSYADTTGRALLRAPAGLITIEAVQPTFGAGVAELAVDAAGDREATVVLKKQR